MTEPVTPREERNAALGPPRFTLRTLWLVMTGFCCLFALMSSVGIVWSMALVLFLSLVLAHVLGNSLGTKLRDRASELAGIDKSAQPRVPMRLVEVAIAAPRRLTERARLSRVTLVMTVGGGVAGGVLGGSSLAETYPEASMAAVILGVVSSAVLGGFAGFGVSSFASVARGALREALSDGEPVAKRRRHRVRPS